MKKILILSSLIALFASNQSFAATTSGTSNVKIVPVIVLTAGAPLEFGSIATTGTAGTVTISTANPTGVVTPANSLTLVSGATRSAGVFSVTGEASVSYTVTLPGSAVTLAGSGSAATQSISVSTFTFIAGTGARTFSAVGADSFSVGATLSVAANQTPGPYTGTYTVIANY